MNEVHGQVQGEPTDNVDALIAEWNRSKAGMFEGSFTEAGDALLAALAEQSRLLDYLVEVSKDRQVRLMAAEVALTTAPADALEGARKAVLNGAPPMNAELTMTPDGPVEDRGMAAYVEGYGDAYVTLTAAIRAAATTEGETDDRYPRSEY